MSKIKKSFSTQKKAVIFAACIFAALAVMATGCTAPSAVQQQSIEKTAAEQLALSDAGVDPSAALVTRTELEIENGAHVYEVEFSADGVEYDYTIDAASGAILKRDTDGQAPAAQAAAAQSAQQPTQQPAQQEVQQPEQQPEQSETQGSDIGLDSAQDAALADAQIAASDVTYTKAGLDRDDGVRVYDIEFYTASAEYDYEIDAATGAIVSKSIETFTAAQQPTQPSQPSQPQGAYIGVDSAKDIAVSHAGIALDSVVFKKAKLENDDGRAEYEVEFISGSTEYEYTIDATSGSILEYDSEYND